ncbi:type I restriction-modification system subunit M/S [Acetobacter sicerae]|uniref:type I restriction-modification system subunit M/S n=1 Tax=Acetobacter sicerae TaxID=85325 RepID=UPI00156AA939|nr:N-6 DNA methylase [Acetobacter sicerae]NHN93846.1 N-6 DNA methylase [Acetobacter sicerae]
MIISLIQSIEQRSRSWVIRSNGLPLLSAAIVIGWSKQRDQTDGRMLFKNLKDQLPFDEDEGLTAAREWLSDPGFSSQDWHFVNESLKFLQEGAFNHINWDDEVSFCLHPERSREMATLPIPLARSLTQILNFPRTSSIACFFAGAASVAWVLVKNCPVTLYVDRDLYADRQIVILMALLAYAAERPLKIYYANFQDGLSLSSSWKDCGDKKKFSYDNFDHIFSIPPFGMRRPNRGAFEAYQIECLLPLAKQSFTTLILDGLLFRETKAEVALRKELATHYRATVMSLPSGIFWPTTAVSSSLLHLEPGMSVSAQMIDCRSMEKASTGRVQENIIVQHLKKFRRFCVSDSDRIVEVSVEQISENGYSLLPERYFKSKNLAAFESVLGTNTSIVLSDIANIERGKAPVPLRESDEVYAITALEITPSDLIDGTVRPPCKQQIFPAEEEPRVKGVTVEVGDILISIKGNVGRVGMVENVNGSMNSDNPWIISQSLAIIRLKPNSHIFSPVLLNVLLTAPWVREKLESMSGATTVRTLPMSALRNFPLPFISEEDNDCAKNKLADIVTTRQKISCQQRKLAKLQGQLWAQMWRMSSKL